MGSNSRTEQVPGRWSTLLGGMGLGALLFYFLDTSQGHSRRVRMRDKVFKATRAGRRGVGRVERNWSNRAQGLLARFRSGLDAAAQPPDDEIVRERVRSAIGRVCSHVGAVEVSVRAGKVYLSGHILEHEYGRVLRTVGAVRGVGAVEDELRRHAHWDGIPGLRQGRSRAAASQTPHA